MSSGLDYTMFMPVVHINVNRRTTNVSMQGMHDGMRTSERQVCEYHVVFFCRNVVGRCVKASIVLIVNKWWPLAFVLICIAFACNYWGMCITFRRFSDFARAERVVSPSVHWLHLQSMMGIQSLLTAISWIAVKIYSNLRYIQFVPPRAQVAWTSGLWRWF